MVQGGLNFFCQAKMIRENRICQANLVLVYRTNISREEPFLFGKNCLGGLILPSKFGPRTKIVRTKSVLGPNLTRSISAVTGLYILVRFPHTTRFGNEDYIGLS